MAAENINPTPSRFWRSSSWVIGGCAGGENRELDLRPSDAASFHPSEGFHAVHRGAAHAGSHAAREINSRRGRSHADRGVFFSLPFGRDCPRRGGIL